MTPTRSHVFDVDLPDDPGGRREARSAAGGGGVAARGHHCAWCSGVAPSCGRPHPPSARRQSRGAGGRGRWRWHPAHPRLYLAPGRESSCPGAGSTRHTATTRRPAGARSPAARREPRAPVAPADSVVATAGVAGPGEGPGAGGGTGGGTGGGQGTGTGTGAGPGAEVGRAVSLARRSGAPAHCRSARPPRPSVVATSTSPSGWPIDGRVERIGIEPPIEDAKYRDYFSEVMMRTWRFRPARAATGEAVPGTVTIGFNLPSK